MCQRDNARRSCRGNATVVRPCYHGGYCIGGAPATSGERPIRDGRDSCYSHTSSPGYDHGRGGCAACACLDQRGTEGVRAIRRFGTNDYYDCRSDDDNNVHNATPDYNDKHHDLYDCAPDHDHDTASDNHYHNHDHNNDTASDNHHDHYDNSASTARGIVAGNRAVRGEK